MNSVQKVEVISQPKNERLPLAVMIPLAMTALFVIGAMMISGVEMFEGDIFLLGFSLQHIQLMSLKLGTLSFGVYFATFAVYTIFKEISSRVKSYLKSKGRH